MQPRLAEHHHIIDGIRLPAVRGNPGMEQAAAGQGEVPRRQSGQLGSQLAYLTGGQKAHTAQIYAQNRLAVCHAGKPGAQQCAVTADGDNLIGFAGRLCLRQKTHPCKTGLTRKALRHKDGHTQSGQHGSSLPRHGKPGVLGRVGNQ